MKHRDDKTIISKEDLDKRVVIISNYADQSELRVVQAGVMDGDPNAIAIPKNGFAKYNKFRKKNGFKPLLLMHCHEVDVSVQKQDHFNEQMEENKTFMESTNIDKDEDNSDTDS